MGARPSEVVEMMKNMMMFVALFALVACGPSELRSDAEVDRVGNDQGVADARCLVTAPPDAVRSAFASRARLGKQPSP